jgi:hypothetical protein
MWKEVILVDFKLILEFTCRVSEEIHKNPIQDRCQDRDSNGAPIE